MTGTEPRPRILFLTPFNFEEERHDQQFDELIHNQLSNPGSYELKAGHVKRFSAEAEQYEAVQESAIIEALKQAESAGFDAIVNACHYDPALAAVRGATSLPVIGPLQLTSALAEQYGPKFSVITDVAEAVPVIEALIRSYGRANACVGVTAIEIDGDDILEDPKAAALKVDALVQDIASEGNVQSVVIGCTIVSAAYELYRSEFPDRGVKVLDSNRLVVEAAAALAI